MTFKEYLLKAPKQDDLDTNLVLEIIRNEQSLPNDVEGISKQVYLKLNHQLTEAFQKLMMMYFFEKNNFKQPTDPKLLDQINFIIDLQNDDKNYPF